ncbi:MAG: hypothetical protein Q9222_001291 [Ikaeria aurantiellina]
MSGQAYAREHSPAFQGARLAFSSPTNAEKPYSNDSGGSHGATAAANIAGRKLAGNGRTVSGRLPPNPDTAAKQEHFSPISYLAASLVVSAPLQSSIVPKSAQPAPMPSQSNVSIVPDADGTSVDALIKRFNGEGDRMSAIRGSKPMSSRNAVSPDTPRNPSQDDPMYHTTVAHAIESAKTPSNLINASDTVAHTRVSQRARVHHVQSPSGLPQKSSLKPAGGLDRSESHTTLAERYHAGERVPVLSNSTIPQLSVDSLANAMVASSLASSRAPSPTRPPLPPPRRRSRPHLFHRTHSADEANSRTPSPSKGIMRTTMRTTLDPGESLAARPRSNRFINKHPNKHHEGDRKRWRDEITEFERKRYEGVWAANRGLLAATYHRGDPTSSTYIFDSASHVINIVARDLWDRSKLPLDVLEEIWDLVDTSGTGALSKEEFVVGMWLIDQTLKGRKLPVKISESVWFSARGLTGIKVRRP